MANPLRLAYLNHADQAIIGAGFAVSSLPPANLKDDDIQKVWRSTSTDSQHILADLGSAKEIGAVALINNNLDQNNMARIRVSNSDPTGVAGEIYDADNVPTAVDPFYGKWLHFIEPAVVGRYVRINLFSLTQTPQAGRLVIGPTWAPSRDMSFGWEKLSRDASTITESLGGNPFVDIKNRRRGWRFRIFPLTEDEAQEQVDKLNLLRGTGRDILVCRNKDSTNLGRDTLWGLLEEPVQQRRVEGGYEIELTMLDRV